MLNLGTVRPGSTIYVPFHTFAGSTGASVTMSGLATSDILIYKDGGTTERASASGYTLLDTDGIDFDAKTGIHGVSINLADNTTADFWKAGSRYFVVVSDITVDSQTVRFIAATFAIGYEDAVLDTHIATLSSQTSFTLNAGPAEDDALNGCVVCIHDLASAVQLGFAVVSDYTGSTKTVTLTAGTTFTVAAGDNISVFPPSNTRWLGTTAQTGRDIGASVLLSNGAGAGQIALSSGAVTVGTNNDKTGYTASTVSDKTGYSLTQAFPTNFSSLAITGGGAVTAGTVSDKTGYSLTNLTVQASTTLATGTHTAQTGDSFARIGANGASLSAVPWNASWDAEVQSEVQDAIEVNHLDHLLAADYDPASKPGVSTALLNELVESDAGVSRFTANALEQGPSGGGGVADWTSDERTAIRSILGIPGSGTTPADPTTGILDTIRDQIGTAGAGLTSIPWNAAWNAEVQSECEDALAGSSLTLGTDALNAIADSVWDEAVSGHLTAGSTGAALSDILVDTGTTLQSELDGIQADTEDIQSRLPAALVSGRIDAYVGAMAPNVITAAATASDYVTEVQSGLATAAALTTVDDFIDTEVAAIKAVTDKLDSMIRLDGADYEFKPSAVEEVVGGGGGGSLGTVSPIIVADSRTWTAYEYRATNIVEVEEGFVGTLALAPDLNDHTTINSVSSVSITGAATVTATDLLPDASRTRAHFTVPALTTVGTYTVLVTVATVDGQTIPTTATLKVY